MPGETIAKQKNPRNSPANDFTLILLSFALTVQITPALLRMTNGQVQMVALAYSQLEFSTAALRSMTKAPGEVRVQGQAIGQVDGSGGSQRERPAQRRAAGGMLLTGSSGRN